MPEATQRRTDCQAHVTHNRQLGKHCYRLGLEFSGEAARLYAAFKPGQFVQLEVTRMLVEAIEELLIETAIEFDRVHGPLGFKQSVFSRKGALAQRKQGRREDGDQTMFNCCAGFDRYPARGKQQDQEGDRNRNQKFGSRPHDLCPSTWAISIRAGLK